MEQILIQISNHVNQALSEKFSRFIELTPFILGAVAVFLFGWILAEIVSRAIIALGHKIKLEWAMDKVGLKHFLERTNSKLSPSEVIAKGMKGYLIFLFFIEATKIAQLTRVSEFLTEVMSYVPEILISVFIILVGIRIGHTVEALISTSLSIAHESAAKALGLAAKYIILTFATLAALAELNIAPILIQVMFVGFISMLALAGGLAFGLGGKDVIKEILESFKQMEMKAARKKKR